MQRQDEVALGGGDGMVHGDQFGAVGKSSLNLHFCNHGRDAFHHLVAAEQLAAEVHQFGNAFAVANEFEQLRSDQRDGLGMIEAQAARKPFLRQDTGLVQD